MPNAVGERAQEHAVRVKGKIALRPQMRCLQAGGEYYTGEDTFTGQKREPLRENLIRLLLGGPWK